MTGLIKIPSDLSNLFRVENLIEKLSEVLNFGDELFGNISVCLVEAVSNAIQHGNGNDVTKIVLLEYKVKNNLLIFYVSDEGNGFDFDKVPDPTLPENIENIKGRGIFLIRNLADKVSFENKGSKIIITFNL
ncbi:MAG: ATP-binding protein [Bacteroidales bacterium]